jgi:hypothetical protein
MFSGDMRVLRVTVLDQDDNVIDLTGLSAAVFVIAKRHGAASKVSYTLGSGITVTDAANGIMEVTILAADTEPLGGAYVHELSITDAANRRTTVLFGSITMRVNTP